MRPNHRNAKAIIIGAVLAAALLIGAIPASASAGPYLPKWEGKRALRGYASGLTDRGDRLRLRGCRQAANWVGCVLVITSPNGIQCMKAKAVRKQWSGRYRFSDITGDGWDCSYV